MAQQTVNIGAAANDHTGESLRAGGDKINQNFTELYARTPLTLAALTAIIAGLPTTLPASPGQLWLNGGVLSLS